jgi:hypothetical protein
MKKQRRDHIFWAEQHKKYTESAEWNELRRTMPGKRKCAACASTAELNLHHMFYPDDLFQTKHCHCCWLCRTCHLAFHRRVKGTLSHPEKTWVELRKHTRKVVLRELKKPTILKPAIQKPQQFPKVKALSSFSGIVVIPPSALRTVPLDIHASSQPSEISQFRKAKEVE